MEEFDRDCFFDAEFILQVLQRASRRDLDQEYPICVKGIYDVFNSKRCAVS